MEPQYRIQELSTIGWTDYNEKTPSMNKEDCQQLFQSLVFDGYNPNRLKIVRVS